MLVKKDIVVFSSWHCVQTTNSWEVLSGIKRVCVCVYIYVCVCASNIWHNFSVHKHTVICSTKFTTWNMDSNTTTKLKCLLALHIAVILAIAVLSVRVLIWYKLVHQGCCSESSILCKDKWPEWFFKFDCKIL
jgi:hypothetical protein